MLRYLQFAGLFIITSLSIGCGGEEYPAYQPPAAEAKTAVEATVQPSPENGFFANYENTNRVAWQKPEMVIELLGDLSNKVVADLGAGQGFFALRLAKSAQKVIALDIDPQYITFLDSIRKVQLPTELQNRLEPRLAKADDAQLETDEIDALVIANTYMYLPDRVNYLRKLRNALKPGGTILILDFKQKRTPIGPRVDKRLPIYQVEEELEAAGFQGIKANDTMLDYQFIVMAKRG